MFKTGLFNFCVAIFSTVITFSMVFMWTVFNWQPATDLIWDALMTLICWGLYAFIRIHQSFLVRR